MAELLPSVNLSHLALAFPPHLSYVQPDTFRAKEEARMESLFCIANPHLQLRIPESRSVYRGVDLRIERYVEDRGICNR